MVVDPSSTRYQQYERIEKWTAYGAVVFAALAGVILSIFTFVAHQACYGMSNAHPVCHAVTGDNFIGIAQTTLVILITVLTFYVAAAFAARWQTRTRHSDARVTAYMALVTSAITILAFTLPAAGGAGFFFLPAMLLLVVSSGFGLPALLQANRDPNRNDPDDDEKRTL
jgi:cation transport ATPase